MQKFAKIIAIVANILCLCATLFMPSSATLIILVPLVAGTWPWIIESVAAQKRIAPAETQKVRQAVVYVFSGWSILVSVTVALVAIFCEYIPSSDVIAIRESVTYWGGRFCSYLIFAWVAFGLITPLYAGELFVPHVAASAQKYGQSFCCEVATAIAEIHN